MSRLELYESFEDLRKSPVTDFIEPAIMPNSSDSVSQLIGLLDKWDSYDIFVPLPWKVLAVNIRDILGARNIISTNPTRLGHIIPRLHQQSKTSEAATIMNLYRLRALPILDKEKIIGQISSKKI